MLNAGWTGANLNLPVEGGEGYTEAYKGMNTLKQFFNETSFYPSKQMSVSYGKDIDKTFIPSTLLEMAWGNTPAPTGHIILDFFNPDRAVSAGLVDLNGQSINTGVDYSNTFDDKPRTIQYVTDLYSAYGRIFYLTGDSLLYSPILAEDVSICGQCHQEADPTSEALSDILSSDGGFIELPEIGEGIKLEKMGAALIVFGTKGIEAIVGGSDTPFSAKQYNRLTLPFFPTQSTDSFVRTEVGIFYLSTVGVCLVSITEQGGIDITNLAEGTIQQYYNELPDSVKAKARGAYNTLNKEVIWLLPNEEDINKYSDVLLYNIAKRSFTKWSFDTEDEYGNASPYIVDVLELSTPFKSSKFMPLYNTYDGDEIYVADTDGFINSLTIENAVDANVDTFEKRLFVLRDPANGDKLIFADITNLNNKDFAHGVFEIGRAHV